jgi:hypothetical protein
MVNNSIVTYKGRKIALQWLTGVLAPFRNLYKWRLTDTAACRLCQAAGEGHECPEHQDQRTGRATVKAISLGARGACIVSARCGQPGNPARLTASRTIPHWQAALPSLMSEQERRALPRRSVPDILMRITDAKTGHEAIHLVELKYCRDNAPEDAAQAAENQHSALMQSIPTSTTAPTSRSVVLHKFRLGVGAACTKAWKESRHTLGVERARQPTSYTS